VFVNLIWVKRETNYFFNQDWTGSISLIGLHKLADWRKQRGWLRQRRNLPATRFAGDFSEWKST
jgi:hypothetical protein